MEEFELLLDHVNIPNANSKVYKDECAFSFTTAESEDGLFVDLSSFFAFSKQYAILNYEKTKHRLYLNIRHVLKKIEKKDEDAGQEPPLKKPTIMGILSLAEEADQKYTTEEFLSIVILPEFRYFPLPEPGLPEKIQLAITGVLTSNAETRKQVASQYEEIRQPSAFALSLVQQNNGVKIPPKGWKCSKCDLTENLWLNLTDGVLNCGRRNHDGSGGNGHAAQHYDATGYPIAVKMGTISATSAPDVYSYPEDDMVIDPLINEHLAHFGINVGEMEKTEKSMAELEVDMNLKLDWSRIDQETKQSEPVYGPGLTGMHNIGNSCYMASVLQCVFAIPEFQRRYAEISEKIFSSSPNDPANDLEVQLAKIGRGLLSGIHSVEPKTDQEKDLAKNEKGSNGITPRAFKYLIGKGHPEFGTARQQDALEFFQYLLNQIERDQHKRKEDDPTKIFKFGIQERIQCDASKKVRYTERTDNILSVPIPIDQKFIDAQEAFEKSEKERKERESRESKDRISQGLAPLPGAGPSASEVPKVPEKPKVSLEACLEAFAANEQLYDFFSSATNSKGTATKNVRLSSFPDYLAIQVRKFYVGQDWTAKKLDVEIQVPDELSLEFLRGTGKKPDEDLLPESAPKNSESIGVTPNESIVDQLMGMGFPRNRCEKAAISVQNSGADQAMNWLFEHMEDVDIDEPIKSSSATSTSSAHIDEESVAMLSSMGFSRDQAVRALKATSGDIERATEWIFSHGADEMIIDSDAGKADQKLNLADGKADYELVSFITHIGSSAQSGHYVCHIKKDGKWVFFNDSKVVQSEHVPKDMGYLYIFRRK